MIYKAIILAVVITAIVAEDDPATTPCSPGLKFNYFCNQCACGADGKGASCTKMACPPGLFNRDGTMRATTELPKTENVSEEPKKLPELPADLSCTAGQMYKNDCNTCRCIKDNVPVCTLMACPKL